MPPPKSHKKLTAAQKETLKRWIAEGAEYQPHWSFIAADAAAAARGEERGVGAATRSTASSSPSWRSAGLTPAPEADRRTLARRLSLDLTGLPPDAGRRRGVRQRHVAGRLREVRRQAAGVAALGRAPRPLLARRRPLRRHARHPLRQLPRDLGLPRLGHQRLQPEPCRSTSSRSSSSPATCCRTRRSTSRSPPASTAATSRPTRAASIDEEYLVLYTRDRTETVVAGLAGPDGRLRRLPRPQVRPAHAARTSTRCRRSSTTRRRTAMDGNIKDTPPIILVPRAEDRPRWDALSKERRRPPRRRSTPASRPPGRDFDKWLAERQGRARSRPRSRRTGSRSTPPLTEGEGKTIDVTVDGQGAVDRLARRVRLGGRARPARRRSA